MAASASRRRACGPSLLLRAMLRRADGSKSLLSGTGMANLLVRHLNQTRSASATPQRVSTSETWYKPSFEAIRRHQVASSDYSETAKAALPFLMKSGLDASLA